MGKLSIEELKDEKEKLEFIKSYIKSNPDTEMAQIWNNLTINDIIKIVCEEVISEEAKELTLIEFLDKIVNGDKLSDLLNVDDE